ncbi:glutaredoxin family protein [Rhodoferax sp.]|uniref:glutaredoxin family protein n=1 Tax=Rhodoferax sp. TaxID=50421 RepID=UPI00260DEA63|nr:glutaredoxin family protein [Rhodoferax sp.]MDD3935902.1 glutaredoxin family protein [Rhodoferax sp.]
MQTPVSADHMAGLNASPVPRWLLAWVCGCIVLGSGQLQAQTIYRIVGPDGQVTFSDMPGASSASKLSPLDNTTAAAAPLGAVLPFELRQVVGKYPVTLYTSSNCAPCDSGRSLLTSRGVPFAEKTINSAQDAEALQKLSGSNSLPFLTVGAQHVAGFSASEWTQYLNAAGYPENSRLPANYRTPPATPMVTTEKPSVPSPAASAAAPAAPTLPPVTDRKASPANPAGIQF